MALGSVLLCLGGGFDATGFCFLLLLAALACCVTTLRLPVSRPSLPCVGVSYDLEGVHNRTGVLFFSVVYFSLASTSSIGVLMTEVI